MSTKNTKSAKSEAQVNADEIQQLLAELKRETDQKAKKMIRAKLRNRDYYISRVKADAAIAKRQATRAAKQSSTTKTKKRVAA